MWRCLWEQGANEGVVFVPAKTMGRGGRRGLTAWVNFGEFCEMGGRPGCTAETRHGKF